MKILLIQNEYSKSALGGASLLCHDIVQALVQRGNEILVLCAGPETDAAGNILSNLHHIKQANDVRELQTIWARAGWLLTSRHNYQATRRAINSFNPDVVYLHNLEWVTNSPLMAATDSGRRVVVHSHNHSYEELWKTTNTKGRYLINSVFKTGVPPKSVDVIAVSESIANGLSQNGRVKKNQIHLICNGIPEAAFVEVNLINDRPHKAMFVGSLSGHKGVHIGIEAVALARRAGMPLELDIVGPVGSPDYVEECRKLARDLSALEYITFVGPLSRTEVWSKLSKAMLLLFPSLCEEAFGLVAAEAMANGAIVVGSDRGAIPEVVGDCGRCVEPTPEALAGGIRDILSMDHASVAQLRSRAYHRAKSLFALEEKVVEIERVLCGQDSHDGAGLVDKC